MPQKMFMCIYTPTQLKSVSHNNFSFNSSSSSSSSSYPMPNLFGNPSTNNYNFLRMPIYAKSGGCGCGK